MVFIEIKNINNKIVIKLYLILNYILYKYNKCYLKF